MNIDDIIENAIKEDVGECDFSSMSCIPINSESRAKLIVKEDGIIAGIEIAKKVFNKVNNKLKVDVNYKDGENVRKAFVILTVEGKTHSILKAERLVLNFMQRMSGIATETNKLVKMIEGTKAKILDTRKTTPNFRIIEKMAVKIGGGENHRMGLYDMVMLKDNHIDYAGGIKKAIKNSNEFLKIINRNLKIEIETRNINEVKQVLEIGMVDRIMLDNFKIEEMKKAVDLINGRFETEASGGITIKTIRHVAETGVDYISVGALTHHINSLDLSLKAY